MEQYVGQISLFAFNYAPVGYAKCEGQLLPISQYSALFSLLGTTYGGDGRTTFALPDFRGRTFLGAGHGAGLDDVRLGERGGANKFTLTNANLPSHTHGLSNIGIGYNEEGPANGGQTFTNVSVNSDDAEELLPLNTDQTQSTGGGQSFSLMNPFLGITVCIALTGVYPSRS